MLVRPNKPALLCPQSCFWGVKIENCCTSLRRNVSKCTSMRRATRLAATRRTGSEPQTRGWCHLKSAATCGAQQAGSFCPSAHFTFWGNLQKSQKLSEVPLCSGPVPLLSFLWAGTSLHSGMVQIQNRGSDECLMNHSCLVLVWNTNHLCTYLFLRVTVLYVKTVTVT